MCDYCGCRSIPEIAALSVDHERIGTLLHGLRHGDDATIDQLIDQLTALLVTHSAREERGIYAHLARTEAGAGYVARFFEEHAQIDAAFAAARHDRRELASAIELLAIHIHDEETDMFPAARQVLGPSDWAAIELDQATGSEPP